MRCMLCDKIQPPSPTCTGCGIHSAYYYCSTCKFWDDDGTKGMYHCRDCGSCFLGQGLGMDAVFNNSCLVCYPRSAVETIRGERSERRLEAAIPPSILNEGTMLVTKPIIESTKVASPFPLIQRLVLPLLPEPASSVEARLKGRFVESSDSAFEGIPFLANSTISTSMHNSTHDKKSESRGMSYGSDGTPDWKNVIDWSQTAGSHTIPSNREQVNTDPIVFASPAYSYGHPQGSAQSFRLPFLKSTSVSDETMESLSESVAGMNMGVRSWK